MKWNVLGHQWAVDLLSEHVARGRLRHAYLITGPEGVGRRTMALRLAQAINCLEPPAPGEFCGVCRACRQFERMQHPDLAVKQSERFGATLKVEAIRELQHSLALAPYEARYRVALLLRFEEANESASNALLKTLEEPPPQVILILTAESAERLLPTIVSRCEVVRLRPLALEETSQGLQTLAEVEPEQARLLAHISGGRPGYALRLHADDDRLQRRQVYLEDHIRLIGENRAARFAYAEGVTKERGKERDAQRERLRETLLTWTSLWRDVLLRAAYASAPITNLDYETQVEAWARLFGLDCARSSVSALSRTLMLTERNVNARLALEVLMLDLPRG